MGMLQRFFKALHEVRGILWRDILLGLGIYYVVAGSLLSAVVATGLGLLLWLLVDFG